MILVIAISFIFIWTFFGIIALAIDDYKELLEERERLNKQIKLERKRVENVIKML